MTMDFDISAADIAWFRLLRVHHNHGEAPGAILVPEGEEPGAFERARLLEESSALARRLERLMIAFFLHAAFAPGEYALRWSCDGERRFEVTPQHLALLSRLSWRTCMTDLKRPYGVSCWFEFDMARALNVPIGRDAQGDETLAPQDEARLAALHLEMPHVLQAYVEHAAIDPGRRLIPDEGWQLDCRVRCVPVNEEAMTAYRGVIAGVVAGPAGNHERRLAGGRLFRA